MLHTVASAGVAALALLTARPASAAITEESLPEMQFHIGTPSTVIYTNAIDCATVLVNGNPANYTSADIDAHGWFKRLETNNTVWYTLSEAKNFDGVYVITWTGNGTVRFETPGATPNLILNDPANRRLVALLPPGQSARVVVATTDPNNHVRDIKCWYPVSRGAGSHLTSSSNLTQGNVTGSTEPAPGATAPRFHPIFLDHVQAGASGVIRFMGWIGHINRKDSPIPAPSWQNRRPQTYSTQNSGKFFFNGINTDLHTIGFKSLRGVCFEDMIDLCNATGRDLWLQVLHDEPESYWRNLADLVAARLSPNLRVWTEFSNELWNSDDSYLQQNTFARQTYAAYYNVPLSDVDSSGPEAGWGSGRAQGLFIKAFKDQWTRVNGQAANRAIGVVSGWQNGNAFNVAAYNSAVAVQSDLVDVFAITTYFSNSIQSKLAPLAYDTSGNASAAVFREAAFIVETNIVEEIYPRFQAAVNNLPVPVVAYEGGQHIIGSGYLDANPGFGNFLANLNRHPLMRDLYLTHWHLWKSAGARTVSLFVDLSTWNQGSGYWGAKQSIFDTGAEYGKWQAFLDYTTAETGVRKLGIPNGAAPTITTTSLANAEVGVSYTQALASSGGDGTRTPAHVGGFLPDGVTFTAGSNGGGTLSGTPTESGLFYVLLRVLDGHKDPAYKLLTLDVKLEGYSTNNLINFSKADVSAIYNLARSDTDSSVLRNIWPFGIADGDRLFATSALPAGSDLHIYGGILNVFTEIPGVPRTNTPNGNPSLKPGEGVIAYHSGTQQVASEDVWMLVWRKNQFNNFADGPVGFGSTAKECSLLLTSDSVGPDVTSLRFVVLNGSTWYVSEAVFTDIGGGEFLLQQFNNTNVEGKRWAVITPTANDFTLPATLSYGPVNFTDVQAVGVHMYGKLNRYGWNHALDNFVALGKAAPPPPVNQTITFNFTGTAPGVNHPWTATSALNNVTLTQGLTYGGTVGTATGNMRPVGPGAQAVSGGGSADNTFRFGLWNPHLIDGDGATRSTLTDARTANNYLTFTITAPAGKTLDLNGGTLTFTYDRYSANAAKDLAVYTSADGFGAGQEIATFNDQTGQLSVTLNGAQYNGRASLEVRIYLYDAIYNATHQSAIGALSLTNNL